MSGEKKSANVDNRLQVRIKELEAYTAKLAIPSAHPEESKNEATRLLSIDPSRLRQLSDVECGEAAVMLTQFAFFIQKEVNRQEAIIAWAEASIRRSLAGKLNQYKGASFEERKMQAVKEHDDANRLMVIKTEAEMRVKQISYLSAKASAMAEQISMLQHSKRKANV